MVDLQSLTAHPEFVSRSVLEVSRFDVKSGSSSVSRSGSRSVSRSVSRPVPGIVSSIEISARLDPGARASGVIA
jgi:hypothetical protein